jgi:sulfofructose kinase
MDILVVGYNACDITVPVDGPAAADCKVEVRDILRHGGGPAATAAVCMARLGARVRLATVFGDDDDARLQRAELLAAGVDLGPSVTAPGHRSPRAVILVDPARESRTIYWSRGDLPTLDAAAVDPAWLDGCDLLYCDGHEPPAATVLAQAARGLGLPVVLDAGSVRPGADALVAACTDVVSSSVFAPALTGQAEPEAALRALRELGPRRVAMTFGERGVLALDETGRRLHHVPAYTVPVRDTTGAGDAFHAGYAFAVAAGRAWLDALAFGAATAALKCRGWGGRSTLPTHPEVEALMAADVRRDGVPPGWADD